MKSGSLEFKKGFKTDSEKKSVLLRKQLGLKAYDPLPAKMLADKLRIEVITPTRIPGLRIETLKVLSKSAEWSAVTIELPDKKYLIIHNDKHSDPRQESDLMHEMAHILCCHPFTGIQLNSNISLRHYNKSHEKEAEWLGGCLQINREALVWAFRRKMNINEIANQFTASLDMVRFRINATGVRRQFGYFDPFKI